MVRFSHSALSGARLLPTRQVIFELYLPQPQ
jgi:hypothetical protein